MATKHLLSTVLLFIQLFFGSTYALPVADQDSKYPYGCEKPMLRKEWRDHDKDEQKQYIAAVKCILKKPAKSKPQTLPGAQNHYEDFLGTHIIKMPTIHFVGIFFPWHRWFVRLYEDELHSCGWPSKYGQPYWDWELDLSKDPNNTDLTYKTFAKSPIFDSDDTGFGGNGEFVPGNFTNPAPGMHAPFDIPGHTGGGCIPNGPFKGMTVNLGPGNVITKNTRCVRRDFAPGVFNAWASKEQMAATLNAADYSTMDQIAELAGHSAGHAGIGGLYGDMVETYSSPSDPLFYLHHSNVDRLWWSWQQRNPSKRLKEISGPLVFMDYQNKQGGNATLETTLDYIELAPAIKVKDVMDISTPNLCYKYDKIY